MKTSLLAHFKRLVWYATKCMKLSMSISSSKSTVRMYLISDPLGVSSVSPSGNSAFRRLRESKPLYRVHSTIELPVTTRHCEYSLVDKFAFQNLQRPGSPFAHRAVRNQRPVELELKELWKLAYLTDHDVSCSTKSLQLFRVPQPVTRDETFHENDGRTQLALLPLARLIPHHRHMQPFEATFPVVLERF